MSMDAGILLSEAGALNEFFALQRDPVFRGVGIPRGDGRLVLVIPGLFGSDFYLEPLRSWLRRIGYRPVRSTMAINAGCPDRLRTQVESALRRSMDRSPGRLAIIGHSRGGMLGWAIASRLQDQVSHLVLLGSPAPAVVAMMRSNPNPTQVRVAASAVANAGQRALRLLDPDCTVPACGCPYTVDLRRDLSPATRLLAVSSREDRVVGSRATQVTSGENVTVTGTHSGLVYNRAVYPLIGRFLAPNG
ncbi:MAG TPA: alpha/beta fold hydrolase [Acidimicrobiales bacterium]|jgi:pimeloyl-ACP methyl ester carboxylesterase